MFLFLKNKNDKAQTKIIKYTLHKEDKNLKTLVILSFFPQVAKAYPLLSINAVLLLINK